MINKKILLDGFIRILDRLLLNQLTPFNFLLPPNSMLLTQVSIGKIFGKLKHLLNIKCFCGIAVMESCMWLKIYLQSWILFLLFVVDVRDNGKTTIRMLAHAKHVWTAPSSGYLKLNTDGTWSAHNIVGGGGVFRRSSGTWFMGFSSKFNASTPLTAELYAIREGLIMAIEYKVDKLELETDALSLMKMLNTMDNHYHHELSPVLNDVASLMKRFTSLTVHHIPRARNLVSHSLAAYSISMVVGHKVYADVPPFSRIAYHGDLQGLVRTFASQGETPQVIDVDADPSKLTADPPNSTQIMFGSIPATISMDTKASGSANAKDTNPADGSKGAGTSSTNE
ncbi:uncharacterized protein [Spinacia oleracea]|uniref:RNase H type-1 domain-containing protein n=1 Tax=Spinacia oleracea TaxID=3562 RepID=A0A9R0K488_SPIOL|nr:uncharacterized protein LOC110796416 [Spinacia oleracea]